MPTAITVRFAHNIQKDYHIRRLKPHNPILPLNSAGRGDLECIRMDTRRIHVLDYTPLRKGRSIDSSSRGENITYNAESRCRIKIWYIEAILNPKPERV